MSKGLAIPVRCVNGRAVRSSGSDQLQKIIRLALAVEDSANPFQDLGIDPDVFQVNDGGAIGRYSNRIDALFKRLEAEGRARLLPGYPQWNAGGDDGAELVAIIKYIDLETDQPEEYQQIMSSPTLGS